MSETTQTAEQPQNKIKRTHLAKWLSKNGYEAISPMEYYRLIFPEGELCSKPEGKDAFKKKEHWEYNAILLENTHKTKMVQRLNKLTNKKEWTEKEVWKSHVVWDDLKAIEDAIAQFGQTESDFFLAPHSYLGRRRIKENERWTYACIIEVDHPRYEIVDGHREEVGMKQLIHEWTISPYAYLMPSACVCSGSGLHLIYLLDRPYDISNIVNQNIWDNFRRKFTKIVWSSWVTKSAIQQENHCQSFRIVGSKSKQGHLVEAFWLSKERYTLTELFSQVTFDEPVSWEKFQRMSASQIDQIRYHLYQSDLNDELLRVKPKIIPKTGPQITPKMLEAKEKYPEWYKRRIVEKQPKREIEQWVAHRGVYDWFLREAKIHPVVGVRYNRIHALAEFAVKCAIPFSEFKADAWELYQIFKDVDAKEPFHLQEFYKARDEYFNKKSHLSTRDWIEDHCKVPMEPPAKRNGNKRRAHLHDKIVKNPTAKSGKALNPVPANREFQYRLAVEEGLVGRPDKQTIVQQWRAEHPDGKKADCIRETGLSKPTVLKWWNP